MDEPFGRRISESFKALGVNFMMTGVVDRGDINKDGKIDAEEFKRLSKEDQELLMAHEELRNADGSFYNKDLEQVKNERAMTIRALDLDGDGKADVYAVDYDGDGIFDAHMTRDEMKDFVRQASVRQNRTDLFGLEQKHDEVEYTVGQQVEILYDGGPEWKAATIVEKARTGLYKVKMFNGKQIEALNHEIRIPDLGYKKPGEDVEKLPAGWAEINEEDGMKSYFHEERNITRKERPTSDWLRQLSISQSRKESKERGAGDVPADDEVVEVTEAEGRQI